MRLVIIPILVVLLAGGCAAPVQMQGQETLSTEAQPEPIVATATALSATLVEINAPRVENPAIVSLHMFDEKNGWGMTGSAVLRTNDGGSTWYNVSPSGETVFGYAPATSFLNMNRAWFLIADAVDPLGSGILYGSDDGGITWTASKTPFGSADMTFIDPKNAWAMVSLGVGAGSMGVAIFRSEDGGASWTQVFTNDLALENGSEDLPLSGIKNHLTPLDTKTAWVSGVVYAPETVYLFKTMDGGISWVEQDLPPAPDMQGADLSIDAGLMFLSAQDGILPVRYFSGESYQTAFYASKDGGQSWEFLSSMPGSGAVDFFSPSDGFFWDGGQFFVTADRGATWTSVTPDVLFGETFSGMEFVNTRTGWVWTYDPTGRYGLFITRDGGSTWEIVGE